MAAPPGYDPVARALHWGVAAMVLALLLLGLGMDELPRGAARRSARLLHEGLGVAALALALLRLGWAAVRPRPALPGTGLPAMAARLGHAALLLLTLAVPLSGMARNWARGGAVDLFGFAWMPPFAIPGGRAWGEVHEALAWSLAALVALHLAAVAWHHWVQRDDTLARMLGRRPGRPPGGGTVTPLS